MSRPVKRVTTIFLVAASFIIWGIVGLSVYNGLEVPENDRKAFVENQQMNPDVKHMVLPQKTFMKRLNALRNPFLPGRKKNLQKKRVLTKQPEQIKIPSVCYVGYIESENGLLAIIEGKKSGTRFCAVGDTAFGLRVIAIKPEKIGVRIGKKTDWVPFKKIMVN